MQVELWFARIFDSYNKDLEGVMVVGGLTSKYARLKKEVAVER
jgi:hypothetical protein